MPGSSWNIDNIITWEHSYMPENTPDSSNIITKKAPNSVRWDIDDGNIPTHPVRTYTDKIMMWKHSYMPKNTPDTSNIITMKTPISAQ